MINKKIEEQKELLKNSILPEDKKENAIKVLDYILSLSEKEIEFLFSNKDCKIIMNSFSVEIGNANEVISKLQQLKRLYQ